MKRWITICLACVLLILAVAFTEAAETLAGTTPVDPTIYFSSSSNACISSEGTDYWVFLHSPDDDGFTGAAFDLYLVGYNVTQPFVIPETGVTLVGLDVSTSPYHIEVEWTQQPLEHMPLVRLVFDTDPGLEGWQTTANVQLTRSGGGTEPGSGMDSFAGCCIDCFYCYHTFYMEDHFLIPVGTGAEIPFEWTWFCYTYGGAALDVMDTQGWVVSWDPVDAYSWQTCGPCFYTRYPGSIAIAIPAGVEVGTTSAVTLSGMNGLKVFTVEAIDPVPTEKTSWGRIKSLFK